MVKIFLQGLKKLCKLQCAEKVDRLNLESYIGLHCKSLFLSEFTLGKPIILLDQTNLMRLKMMCRH